MTNFQRINSISNAHVGRQFEKAAHDYFATQGIELSYNHCLQIGISSTRKKEHAFDLGSDNPKIVVECKSHKWTTGDNVPSAKLTVWNEAMYFFSLVPPEYRKVFFVLQDCSARRKETLAEYYMRTYGHLIPDDVEIWEFDEDSHEITLVKGKR